MTRRKSWPPWAQEIINDYQARQRKLRAQAIEPAIESRMPNRNAATSRSGILDKVTIDILGDNIDPDKFVRWAEKVGFSRAKSRQIAHVFADHGFDVPSESTLEIPTVNLEEIEEALSEIAGRPSHTSGNTARAYAALYRLGSGLV